LIALESVSRSFDGGRTFAVRDVSIEVPEGETLVLLGSSGSGKSTVLKMINRLIDPTAGTVRIAGRDAREHDPVRLRRSMGYVFQGIGLFPHWTARENVEAVPRLLGWPADRRRRRAEELMDMVGLPPGEFGNRLPAELSGGQQQRVGVARALAADPSTLLMDEPFGALDPVTRESLQAEVAALKRRLGKTIVFVTHDVFEALALADRIAVLHQGRLEQVGAPKDVLGRPATRFVRDLFDRPARAAAAFRAAAEAGGRDFIGDPATK